jgi:uncharacterized protein (DUF4415 family)
MSDAPTTKRVRGKGKHPAKVHVNVRLSQDVLEFYKGFPSYTGKMREVLTNYAKEHNHEESSSNPVCGTDEQ